MSEQRWMQELVDAARRRKEGQPAWLDDRWERLAAGSLSAEERAELEALAESSEEARRLWELCQPLPTEARKRIVRRLVEQGREASRPPAAGETGTRRLLAQAWWWAPATLVAASLAAVMVLWPGRAAPPLPEYSARLEGGVQAQRSPDLPPAVPIFRPGTRFELTLRPRTRVEGRLEVRAFLVHGERFEPWWARDVPPGKGAVTLDGVVGEDIELRPGEWSLWVIVARPGAMPEIGELRARIPRGGPEGQGWVLAAPLKLKMEP